MARLSRHRRDTGPQCPGQAHGKSLVALFRDNLAIFSVGIKNSKGGATSEEEFNLTKNISSVKLRARATGVLIAKSLNLEATLKRASAITGSGTTSPSPTTGGESGNNGGNTGGNSGSNNSGNTPGGNTPGDNGDDPEN